MKTILKRSLSLLAISLLCFVCAFFVEQKKQSDNKAIEEKFQRTLHEKESSLDSYMQDLSEKVGLLNAADLFLNQPDHYTSLFEKKGIALLIYEKDSLLFWSDNAVIPNKASLKKAESSPLQKLQRGWFEIRSLTIKNSNKKVVGLLRIKNEFPYQNKYLVNTFQRDFSLEREVLISEPSSEKGDLIYDKNGEEFCKLAFSAVQNDAPIETALAFLLYLTGILLLIIFLRKECDSFARSIGSFWSTSIFVLTIIALRFVTILLHFPDTFYSLDLFGPKYFADATSFWLPSLGDFLINSVLFLFLSYFIYTRFTITDSLLKIKYFQKIVLAVLVLLLICWASWIINNLFVGLIRNSNIPFNINNLFNLTLYSYIGLFIICCILFSFFLLADKLLEAIANSGISSSHLTGLVLFALSAHTLICHIIGMRDLVAMMWSFVIIIIILLLKKKNILAYPFWSIVILVFAFSLYSVHTFLKHTNIKENGTREAFAEKLSAEKDPVAEHLFTEIESQLNADTVIKNVFNSPTPNYEIVEKRLQQQYFSGYWERYDINIALCDFDCAPLLKSSHPHEDHNAYFDNIIETKGEETFSDHFFYIPNDYGKIHYLAKLPFYYNDTLLEPVMLYVDLESKFISEEIGFPELLLDRSVDINAELKNYSYAKYKNGELISQYGKYSYSLYDKEFGKVNNQTEFKTIDGYNHLLYNMNGATLVVLSKKSRTLLDEITTFSYLFTFFSLILLVVSVSRQFSKGLRIKPVSSFKYRLQILLVCLVLVSLILFGSGTIYFIEKQYEEEARENITEKMHSVLIEVQGKLAGEEKLTSNFKEYASYILNKFSNIFFTDINLYDLNGNLLASSRARLFDEGLVSEKINPVAYTQLAVLGKTEFIHNESIGRLKYLSAYVTFKNKEGKVLAYLNLPYFAKQSELEKEISTFLVALVNVYVLLFALTVLIAIFFSNYLTRPLKIIQEKMSKIKLGQANEFIEWNDKDEIGNLISEYNRMLVELSNSAELLAKSERESAWREMAKQVAHEIKNPLTPMKLSIQHLKKVWKDKSPDMDARIERITHTLIEQIDTLSSIASEFSNFAKMPKATREEISIKNILANAIDLYKDSIEIVFIDELKDRSDLILADKEQLLRVFNNLIRNSIQAVPEDRAGKIEIKISQFQNSALVSIKDNGSGIDETIIDKIFAPNFTTKTGGMGLGLAMVKNIVESSDGKIWFETTKGAGTSFYISLPLVQK